MKRKKKIIRHQIETVKKRKSRYSEGGNNSEYCVVLIFCFRYVERAVGSLKKIYMGS
jgi:hypothetical protein